MISIDREMLWQWDYGQRVQLHDVPVGTKVHFSNAAIKPNAIVKEAYEDGEGVYANIPDILLQTAGTLTAYIYLEDGDEGHTEYRKMFIVRDREKPDDYVYTEDDVKTWVALEERIKVLEESGGGPGGGGTPSEEVWEDIADITLEETVSALHITTDSNGNPFALKEFKAFVVQKPIPGNTSNTAFCMAINGEGWGGTSEMKFKGTPKETDATVYSYFHVKTVDGVMEKYRVNSSYDFASLSGHLTETAQRNNYMTSLRFDVNTSTGSLKTTAMPCVKISIVGYTSNILAAGSRIQVRGIRA